MHQLNQDTELLSAFKQASSLEDARYNCANKHKVVRDRITGVIDFLGDLAGAFSKTLPLSVFVVITQNALKSLVNFIDNDQGIEATCQEQYIDCNISKNGGRGYSTYNVFVGNKAITGIGYNFYDVPDALSIKAGSYQLYNTGCTSGARSQPLGFSSATGLVTITVNGACRGDNSTGWDFQLTCQ
ncbi:hypothetical protein BegalDRAFT_3350 [Beggiatoa alba B18LD]|uniref:Uncharacterized protein n=1 Tax=Beggiatoa alba B18LD TaxID=395493 RepID=I3CKM5_9GAMM|nr:hypothetical protein BegalDRAFT_3350 [Beggiatoa alba B18LD]